MKISELKELHGLPMKVTRHEFVEGGWFEIIADSRNNDNYPCFTSNGLATAINNYFNDWELYVEPKPKKKLYAWAVELYTARHSFVTIFTESGTEKPRYQALHQWSCHRLPHLDCEVEE